MKVLCKDNKVLWSLITQDFVCEEKYCKFHSQFNRKLLIVKSGMFQCDANVLYVSGRN